MVVCHIFGLGHFVAPLPDSRPGQHVGACLEREMACPQIAAFSRGLGVPSRSPRQHDRTLCIGVLQDGGLLECCAGLVDFIGRGVCAHARQDEGLLSPCREKFQHMAKKFEQMTVPQDSE